MGKHNTTSKKEEKLKKTTSERNSVEDILESFKSNLHGVKFYFNKFGGIAQSEDKDASKVVIENIFDAFKAAGIDLKETEKDKKKIELDDSQIIEIEKNLRKKPKFSVQNFRILSSSSFLMLNNYFEYLIADLLSYHYNKFKGHLNNKEFKISLKEIDEYETVKELEEYLILKEVETMLIELSFDQVLNHFEKKLDIELNNDLVDWPQINEARERRHLIVHNASRVNKKYISRTGNPYKNKIGDKLKITKEYFQKSFEEFRLAGLLLCYNCWGEWDQKLATEAIKNMLVESFEYLQNDNPQMCEKLCKYISNIEARDEFQEDLLLRAKFNRCIAVKQQDRKDDLKKILESIKVGTATPLFKLAHAILSNKKNDIILDLFEKSVQLEEIDLEKYREWPLFETIRNKKSLNSKIEKKFFDL